MSCTFPFRVGFRADGKTITFSKKNFSKEYPTFQLPCGRCLGCRIEYSRQWAVRCVHESMMFEKNMFLTLTYNEEHLPKDGKLVYRDFQLFMKRLRKKIFDDVIRKDKIDWKSMSHDEKQNYRREFNEKHGIGFFVTGEYGEINKRPHWHALIFNYQPDDAEYVYQNEGGAKYYESAFLAEAWPFGSHDFSEITFESAAYVARYAAKKLSHGHDGDHPYEPVSKKSNKRAIGRSWVEKYYSDAFNKGYIILRNGVKCGIPRYYEKWFKENHPSEWLQYVTDVKLPRMAANSEKNAEEFEKFIENVHERFRREEAHAHPLTPNQIRNEILKQKLDNMRANAKL